MKFLLLVLCNFLLVKAKYSTKTAYYESFDNEQLEFLNNVNNQNNNRKLENCTAEQIYVVLRHGSRLPSNKQVEKSKKFLKDVVDYYEKNGENERGLNEIRVSFSEESNYRLSDLGADEMRTIGKRFRQRFNQIFNTDKILTPLESALEFIDIISSDRDRSKQSALNFLKGVYDFQSNSTRIAEYLFNHRIFINNKMMRTFDECENYVRSVKRNVSAIKELLLFKNGKEMSKLLSDLKQRHYIQGLDLDPGLLSKLFTLCNIELAHKMPENWCKLFIRDDYQIMSYLNDLKGYWMKSYGNQINSKMAFVIIQDLFTQIENYIDNNEKRRKIILRFGHAENIFPLVTALGLFKDDLELNSHNFDKLSERRFRSAYLTPFSSNIAFTLYKCFDSYKVLVLVNELPVNKLRNAGSLKCDQENESICDLNDFKQMLSEFLELEFESLCEKEAGDKFYCTNDNLNQCKLDELKKHETIEGVDDL